MEYPVGSGRTLFPPPPVDPLVLGVLLASVLDDRGDGSVAVVEVLVADLLVADAVLPVVEVALAAELPIVVPDGALEVPPPHAARVSAAAVRIAGASRRRVML
ncbi:hypothetical protein [Branchiibius sp. NY16-3462-2]|uniref:hypothetical protein n=1 Tax=Branchiibius sp. NY16-3462-2 TaxID=1807500 RepID=UPI0025BE984B|nr:hypothetical protein [Branchiibius sp. NY16-3462-2]